MARAAQAASQRVSASLETDRKTDMHVWNLVQGIEAITLAGVGAWCLLRGRRKLAFVPLVCAMMVGVVAFAA
ncbi:hypothetical protein WL75_31400 [Burkholderia ubonensis]|nr:hypothetical protein WL75_31400 [Burkholderia ubonensis]